MRFFQIAVSAPAPGQYRNSTLGLLAKLEGGLRLPFLFGLIAMKRNERHLIYEAIALMFFTVMGIFVVPTLVSERNSITAVAGGMLLFGWLVWMGYFVYRIGDR